MTDPEHVREEFGNRYGNADGVRMFRAPGRVNIIGEHTDYNDGFVLPCPIDRDTVVAARPRNDSVLRVYSLNRTEERSCDLSKEPHPEHGHWLNYVEGTARHLERKGFSIRGADIVLESDVPVGAGLSSSASLEMAIAAALMRLANHPYERKAMAMASQEGEHEYTGAMIGIMDQFVSAFGEQGYAMLLDCRSLEYESIALDLKKEALLVCDTGVKHDLAASAYNDRRRECQEAVELLKQFLPGISSLRDVPLEKLEAFGKELPDTLYRRAHHVITENARTLRVADCLRDKRFHEIADLMYASHESLKNDYEVSSPELDLLVETGRQIPGVFGTRMTGGGFGGCTVSFVQEDRIREFHTRMTDVYGPNLKIYNLKTSRGAEEVLA